VRRNALVALGNTGDPDDAEVVAAIRQYAHGDDALLRRHAQWAAGRLGLAS
jgi:epoxyqueuosine reductase QueG